MSIVRMKKLTVLCRAQDRDGLLEGLRNLGVLHVKPFHGTATTRA